MKQTTERAAIVNRKYAILGTKKNYAYWIAFEPYSVTYKLGPSSFIALYLASEGITFKLWQSLTYTEKKIANFIINYCSFNYCL